MTQQEHGLAPHAAIDQRNVEPSTATSAAIDIASSCSISLSKPSSSRRRSVATFAPRSRASAGCQRQIRESAIPAPVQYVSLAAASDCGGVVAAVLANRRARLGVNEQPNRTPNRRQPAALDRVQYDIFSQAEKVRHRVRPQEAGADQVGRDQAHTVHLGRPGGGDKPRGAVRADARRGVRLDTQYARVDSGPHGAQGGFSRGGDGADWPSGIVGGVSGANQFDLTEP
jgi:hypothetical protein